MCCLTHSDADFFDDAYPFRPRLLFFTEMAEEGKAERQHEGDRRPLGEG